MRGKFCRSVALIAAWSLVVPPPSFAQTTPAATSAEASEFNTEQLDALLAQIALYPDALLAQVLMASTYPLQVVDASRWLAVPANKGLSGDALSQALAKQNWDPSVKSLIPFPQALAMLNDNLDWTQQLGYAFATQEADVMASVQRLRLQAQEAGYLKTNEQQRVVVEKTIIVIEPANPQTVYIPVYNPTVVYGAWPYPVYPPVYFPPPPGYVIGTAFVAGLAFAAGVAVVGPLWGWARPSWYGGHVNINVNRYNNINVNRPPINSPVWRPPAGGVGGRPIRPPGGPVGGPARPVPLPANAIGRPNVNVSNTIVNKPAIGNSIQGGNNIQRPGGSQPSAGTPGQRPGAPAQGGNAQRPAGGGQPGAGRLPGSTGGQRPGAPTQGGNAPRPGGGQPSRGTGAQRPGAGGSVNRPPSAAQRPAGALGGINDGARAGQYGNRGAQSRAAQPHPQQRAAPAGRSGGGRGGAPRQAGQPNAGGGGGRAGNRRN